MSTRLDTTQDNLFDPFSKRRPHPPSMAAGHGGTVKDWHPAVLLFDPGDDPTDDPDPAAHR
jgi:hypothetical protein